jgi:3-phenylpropionate/trans-cinnamate dioxygenase ferredoxin reductase component
MSNYKYIIVGGGMTGDSAAKGIREIDKSGTIALFSDEKALPYNRPPLSKALWKGEPIDSIWRTTEKAMAEEKIDFFGSTSVISIDASSKIVKTSDGKEYRYEKLLLATGGRPRKLPFGGDNVIYFRTAEDYGKLRSLSERVSDFVVIGGGFIGSEIAAALAMNRKKVTMVFPDGGIGARVYPRDLSAFLGSYYKEKDVKVLSGESVVNIDETNGRYRVKLAKGESISADAVVAGLGIIPNVELAKGAGVTTDNGFVVNEFLMTTKPEIYAAGDVANFYSPVLDRRLRVEHEDNANTMGKIAGHNMAGKPEPYHHIPFFYSDLFDLGYEAVGELDSQLEIHEDWEEEFRKGVVYYLKDGNVRGVLLWNTWGKVDVARELITSKKKFALESLKGLIKD